MTQPDLFTSEPPTTALSLTVTGPVCYYGQSGLGWVGNHHCWQCELALEVDCRAFEEAVTRGEYDADGYTPAERKAQKSRTG